jgi:uncharacterized repeat protein (TIGR03803 family)
VSEIAICDSSFLCLAMRAAARRSIAVQIPSRGGLTAGHDGNFYGNATQGGSSGDGTDFKVTPKGTLTVLHNFVNTGEGFPGQRPRSGRGRGHDGRAQQPYRRARLAHRQGRFLGPGIGDGIVAFGGRSS